MVFMPLIWTRNTVVIISPISVFCFISVKADEDS